MFFPAVSPPESSRLLRRVPWSLAVALLTLALFGAVTELVLQEEKSRLLSEQRQALFSTAGEIRAVLESELNATLHLATGLDAYIRATHGTVRPTEIDAILANLFDRGRYIRNIGLAPGNRLTYIYPLAGNEKAIGLYYPDVPSQWPAVARVIREGKPVLAGPVRLVQGGEGLIYRVPVFIDDGRYWGVISTVIDSNRLFLSIAPIVDKHRVALAIRGRDGLGALGGVIFGDGRLFEDGALKMTVDIPGGQWQLAVRALEGTGARSWLRWARFGGWTVALLLAGLAYFASSFYRRQVELAACLRHSETVLRTTLDSTADGILVLDADGRLLTANRRFREMWHLPEAVPGSAGAWIERMEERLAEPASFPLSPKGGNTAILLRLRDGRLVESVSCPLDLEGGARLWSFHDVTDVHRAEAALRELNAGLEKRVEEEVAKNREKDHLLIQQSRLAAMGEMIGNIAHQWRQPLNALGLLLANIRDAYAFGELDGAFLDNSLKDGNALVRRMSSTIDDFRHFFRPDKVKGDFSLREAIGSAVRILEPAFQHVQVAVELEEGPDVGVSGFANEFSQVLLNILSNAKDALQQREDGKGRVDIRFGRKEGGAFVVVRDNGGGIPEEVLPKIFDPYFTTKEGGTGIGLYMSRMIMEHMGGTIEARNADGGAVFTVTLPLANAG